MGVRGYLALPLRPAVCSTLPSANTTCRLSTFSRIVPYLQRRREEGRKGGRKKRGRKEEEDVKEGEGRGREEMLHAVCDPAMHADLTALVPDALVAAMPQTEASAPGSTERERQN